jgi:outer membrane biosynthesis protein TonB
MSEEKKRSYLLFNSIDIHLADARREFDKLEDKGVKVAATRARKQLASVTEHIKELRKLALNIQKGLPIAKRPVKAAEEEEASESEGEVEQVPPIEEAHKPTEKPKEKPKVRKHRKKKQKEQDSE